MRKIDDKGNYLNFHGITIISFLHFNKILLDKVKEILDADSNLNKYYSTLPSESYHMTIKNHLVGTEEFVQEERKKNVYIEIDRLCKDWKRLIPAKAVGMDFGNTIQILLEIEKSTSEKVNLFRDTLVKLGSKREDNFIFHMTLAYKYRSLDKGVDFKNLQILIGKLLKDVILTFEPPALCVFKDMTKFTPLFEKRCKTYIYLKHKNTVYTLIEMVNVYIPAIESRVEYIGFVENGKLIPNSDTIQGLILNAIYGQNSDIKQNVLYINDELKDFSLFSEIWSETM